MQGGVDMRSVLRDAGGHELAVTAERIRVDYLSAASETWKHTDTAGHEHAYVPPAHTENSYRFDAEGRVWEPYPTLIRVSDGWHSCETCDDGFEDYHLECRQCGETIWPASTGPGTEYLSGAVRYEIDGQPVSEEEATAFTARVREEQAG